MSTEYTNHIDGIFVFLQLWINSWWVNGIVAAQSPVIHQVIQKLSDRSRRLWLEIGSDSCFSVIKENTSEPHWKLNCGAAGNNEIANEVRILQTWHEGFYWFFFNLLTPLFSHHSSPHFFFSWKNEFASGFVITMSPHAFFKHSEDSLKIRLDIQ